MGASNNENLAPMIDMIEDINLPHHTELDKELEVFLAHSLMLLDKVTFTNVT